MNKLIISVCVLLRFGNVHIQPTQRKYLIGHSIGKYKAF